MPKFIILPEINDILYFKSAGLIKSTNFVNNNIRENVIANMLNLDSDYFEDNCYSADWVNLHTKFITTMSSLGEFPLKLNKIKKMGGMKYNYDFLVSFKNIQNNNDSKNIKIEFKHNNSNIVNLVQFLELYDKDCVEKYNICSKSYAEFYYDEYLDKYLNIEDNLLNKPKKDEYLKNVYDINYKHMFFKNLYLNKNNLKNEKKRIANESVKNYLKTYSQSFNFDKIKEKIIESQKDKVFLLWDCENFYTKSLDISNIDISGIKKIDNLYFDVNIQNFEYDVRVRLNWGNNNGISNPRWKFSFISK